MGLMVYLVKTCNLKYVSGRRFTFAEQTKVRAQFQSAMQEEGQLQGVVDIDNPEEQWLVVVEDKLNQPTRKKGARKISTVSVCTETGSDDSKWPSSENTEKVWVLRQVGRSRSRALVAQGNSNLISI